MDTTSYSPIPSICLSCVNPRGENDRSEDEKVGAVLTGVVAASITSEIVKKDYERIYTLTYSTITGKDIIYGNCIVGCHLELVAASCLANLVHN
jgi:hypothetical protein